MFNATLQYQRLRRHRDHLSSGGCDEVSLLDLAHALRIWVDMKEQIAHLATSQGFDIQLPHASLPKKVGRILKRHPFFYVPLPGGLETPGLVSYGLCGVETALDDRDRKIFEKFVMSLKHAPQKLKYIPWLGAAAFRVQHPSIGPDAFEVSREMAIKRVANTLGGSHPGIPETAQENRFDAPIRHMMTLRFSDIPAPYFILLKIASDILDAFAPVVGESPALSQSTAEPKRED